MNYIETNCTIEHEGDTFESGGAYVDENYIIGYLGENNVLTDWHGNLLGTYRITSTWDIQSFLSSTMHQVEATVDGITYTGRSLGKGMSYKGKRKRQQ